MAPWVSKISETQKMCKVAGSKQFNSKVKYTQPLVSEQKYIAWILNYLFSEKFTLIETIFNKIKRVLHTQNLISKHTYGTT